MGSFPNIEVNLSTCNMKWWDSSQYRNWEGALLGWVWREIRAFSQLRHSQLWSVISNSVNVQGYLTQVTVKQAWLATCSELPLEGLRSQPAQCQARELFLTSKNRLMGPVSTWIIHPWICLLSSALSSLPTPSFPNLPSLLTLHPSMCPLSPYIACPSHLPKGCLPLSS